MKQDLQDPKYKICKSPSRKKFQTTALVQNKL